MRVCWECLRAIDSAKPCQCPPHHVGPDQLILAGRGLAILGRRFLDRLKHCVGSDGRAAEAVRHAHALTEVLQRVPVLPHNGAVETMERLAERLAAERCRCDEQQTRSRLRGWTPAELWCISCHARYARSLTRPAQTSPCY